MKKSETLKTIAKEIVEIMEEAQILAYEIPNKTHLPNGVLIVKQSKLQALDYQRELLHKQLSEESKNLGNEVVIIHNNLYPVCTKILNN